MSELIKILDVKALEGRWLSGRSRKYGDV